MEIKNKFMLLFILILIPMVSSTQVYSGDSYSFESEEFDSWGVVGNSSDVEGMNIDWEDGNITIEFNKYQQSDNFTIIFFNKSKEIIKEIEVPTTIYSGGGGGSTKYIDRNVTVEVPKFYDRNITEIVEKEILNEKIIYEEPNPLWFYLSLSVIFLCIILGILYLRSRSIKSNVRRFKKNE